MSPSKFDASSDTVAGLIVLLLRRVAFTDLVCKRQPVVSLSSVLCKISLNVFFKTLLFCTLSFCFFFKKRLKKIL